MLLAGCGSSGQGYSLDVGGSDAGAFGVTTGDASGVPTFDAYIESDHVALSFVTLACESDCATVEAVATGGTPPYSFVWDDGSTNPQRQVCPTSSTNYHVTATDTGTVGEFTQAPQSVRVPLTADVLACPDGGAWDAGSGACTSPFLNPLLEGTPGLPVLSSASFPSWTVCAATDVCVGSSTLDGTAGSYEGWIFPGASDDAGTYACVHSAGGLFPPGGGVGQPLCSPVAASDTFTFKVDAMQAQPQTQGTDGTTLFTSFYLEVLGGDDPCTGTNVLWTSPPLTTSWTTYCVTIQPAQTTRSLTFEPTGDPSSPSGAQGLLLLDNIEPAASCP